MSESKITASFKSGDHEVTGVPVVNPGDWFGKAWLITVADCAFPPQFIVEADNASDAQDEFVESDYGKSVRIDEDDLKDYGFPVSKGDIIGGKTVQVDGWMRLDGEWQPEQDGLIENNYLSGNGILADTSSIQIDGMDGAKCPFKCLYHGEGIPEGGLTPLEYTVFQNCDDLLREAIVSLPGGLHGNKRPLLDMLADAWEIGRENGEDVARESVHSFYEQEIGGNWMKLMSCVKEAHDILGAVQDRSEGEQHILDSLWPFLQKARALRDCQCRIEWMPEGPVFRWFGSEDGKVKAWSKIEDVPTDIRDGRVRWTFERMLEDKEGK